jgi:hypothetical protein
MEPVERLLCDGKQTSKQQDRKFTSKAVCLNSDDYTKRSDKRMTFVDLSGPW